MAKTVSPQGSSTKELPTKSKYRLGLKSKRKTKDDNKSSFPGQKTLAAQTSMKGIQKMLREC